MVEGWRSGVERGLWVLALTLAACPGPQAMDAGTGSSGGTVNASRGPCSDAGLCPADQYCQALITECAGQPGVTVQSGQPGVCYLKFPCAGLAADEAEGDCTDAACNGDNDCGLSAEEANTVLTCQEGFCDLPGQGIGGEGSSSSGGSGGSSGTGGPQGPTCPTVPAPCPAGCSDNFPLYGCPSCLCDQCPAGDAGIGDAGPPDGGSDGG